VRLFYSTTSDWKCVTKGLIILGRSSIASFQHGVLESGRHGYLTHPANRELMRRLMLYKDSRNDGELSPQLWLSVLDAIESNNYRKKH
jgi:hypothetical protein